MPALLDTRCEFCGVLAGAPHHLCCGYSPELSPDGKLVRISAAPCEWCSEFYPILGNHQRHHSQNPECARKARNARLRRIREEKNPVPKHTRPRREPSPRTHTPYPQTVAHPYHWARHVALRKGFQRLRFAYPEDFAQELEVILLELKLPRSEPTQIDADYVRRYIRRSLYRMCKDYALMAERSVKTPHVDIEVLQNYSLRNWQTTWANA
jgi:hypothetical protein